MTTVEQLTQWWPFSSGSTNGPDDRRRAFMKQGRQRWPQQTVEFAFICLCACKRHLGDGRSLDRNKGPTVVGGDEGHRIRVYC